MCVEKREPAIGNDLEKNQFVKLFLAHFVWRYQFSCFFCCCFHSFNQRPKMFSDVAWNSIIGNCRRSDPIQSASHHDEKNEKQKCVMFKLKLIRYIYSWRATVLQPLWRFYLVARERENRVWGLTLGIDFLLLFESWVLFCW